MESVSETWRVTMFWIDKDCHVYTFTVVYILASMLLHLASKCRHYRGRHFAFSKITKYKQRKNIQYKSTSYDLNSSKGIKICADIFCSWVLFDLIAVNHESQHSTGVYFIFSLNSNQTLAFTQWYWKTAAITFALFYLTYLTIISTWS